MLVQLGLCVEFLRCHDVKKLVRTCKDVDDIQVLSLKTTKAAAEKELNQDIRDEAAAKRARHARGDITPTYSEYSFGFSIDSDGHWLEHDHTLQLQKGLARQPQSFGFYSVGASQ